MTQTVRQLQTRTAAVSRHKEQPNEGGVSLRSDKPCSSVWWFGWPWKVLWTAAPEFVYRQAWSARTTIMLQLQFTSTMTLSCLTEIYTLLYGNCSTVGWRKGSWWRRMGKWRRGSTHSYSQHYMDVSGHHHAPAALLPTQNIPYLLAGSQIRLLPLPGIEPHSSAVQSVS